MKLRNINEEMPINVSPNKMWEILALFGDVSDFHAGVKESYNVDRSDKKAEMGRERICNIVDMGLKIQLKERITKYHEGVGYQYEVFEWKNFPLYKMTFGFAISKDSHGKALLRIDIDYKAKPAFLTPLMVWKMKSLAHDILLGYKHYAETGEKNISIKLLRKKYRQSQQQILTQS